MYISALQIDNIKYNMYKIIYKGVYTCIHIY